MAVSTSFDCLVSCLVPRGRPNYLVGNLISSFFKMAPKKVACGKCSAPIISKQQFIDCCGGCKRRYHSGCINIRLEEYNVLMSSGSSAYKCSVCTRRNRAASEDTTTQAVPDGSDFESEDDSSPENTIVGEPLVIPRALASVLDKIVVRRFNGRGEVFTGGQQQPPFPSVDSSKAAS